MQTTLDIAVATLAWVVTILKFHAVRRNGRWAQDERVLRSWAFVLFFALGMTFQVDAVYFAVDTLTGVNNLSWLFAYVFVALAIYFVSTASCMAMKVRQPRWMLPYLMVTLCLFALIFSLGITTSPDWAEHTIPRNLFDLLFMELMYLYAIVLGTIPALAFARFTRSEGTLPTRIRTGVTLAAVILALAFFVAKVVLSLLGFLHPSLPFVRFLSVLAMALMGAAGLVWSLVFAPNRLYLTLAGPFTFCQKVLTLRDLRRLQTRLNRLCPPVAPEQAGWWDHLRNLDFHIYRAVIGILDGKKMLADQLQALGAGLASAGPMEQPGLQIALPTGLRPGSIQASGHRFRWPVTFARQWDERATEEAIRLHRALQSAPEPEDFQCLVAVYRNIGRRLKVSTGLNPGVGVA